MAWRSRNIWFIRFLSLIIFHKNSSICFKIEPINIELLDRFFSQMMTDSCFEQTNVVVSICFLIFSHLKYYLFIYFFLCPSFFTFYMEIEFFFLCRNCCSVGIWGSSRIYLMVLIILHYYSIHYCEYFIFYSSSFGYFILQDFFCYVVGEGDSSFAWMLLK